MWEGTYLPEQLLCSCNGDPHHRSGYSDMPIMKAAREYPSGSSSFLETNFQQAFRPALGKDGDTSEVNHRDFEAYNLTIKPPGKCSWVPTLGLQAPFPHLWQKQQDANDSRLLSELRFDGSPYLHIDLISPIASDLLYSDHDYHDTPRTLALCLFKLDLRTDIGLTAEIHFKPCPSFLPNLGRLLHQDHPTRLQKGGGGRV